ncbi:Repressor of filamentous growth [Salix suchowensis]|nr:Repressor of filamentous growth [Salix suchowensis]
MPAVRTRLLGWSSGGNDPNVDAPLPQRSFPNFFSFQTHLDDDSLSTETHDSSRHTTTPIRTATPSTPPTIPIPINSSPSTPSSGSTDPTHVRRPRNSFIIFRCKYSREHTKSQLPDTPVVNDTIAAKSLSKRASEAWSKLTQEEKKVFEDMASLEKEEHARKNPDYRFKPKKRQQDSKRPPSYALQFDTAPKVVDPAVKAARRRSASAPQPYKPVALPALPQIERPDIHQRSGRSLLDQSPSLTAELIIHDLDTLLFVRFRDRYHHLHSLRQIYRLVMMALPSSAAIVRYVSLPQSRMLSYTGSMQGHFNPDGSTQIPAIASARLKTYLAPDIFPPWLRWLLPSLDGAAISPRRHRRRPCTISPIESPLLWQENCIVSQSPDISQAQSPSYPILDNKSYTNVDNANVLYNDSPLGLSTPPYSESDTSPPPFMLSNFLPGSEPYRKHQNAAKPCRSTNWDSASE